MNISVLILTYNESINIKRCLSSLQWSDDIVILDSYSDDNTREISEEFKVRFFQRTFDNYSKQRNFGINKINYKNKWLLMVDADEVVSLSLKKEIFDVLSDPSTNKSLYYMRRKDYFWGKWIKHSSGYPTWFGRLMKIGHVVVKRSINEEYETTEPVGFLQHHLGHYPFSKGLDYWIERHNKYSTLESVIYKKEKNRLLDFFTLNPVRRRKAIKHFVYNLPARPLVYFFVIYFLRKGFLDGSAGFHFCMLKTVYEYFICCKIKDNKINNS